jgi:hypothetical protein
MKRREVIRIEWMQKDSEMVVTLREYQGVMEYQTRLIMPSSFLNQFLLDLQKVKGDLDLDQKMRVEQWSEDEFNFVFDFSDLNIDLSYVQGSVWENQVRYIRA